MKTYFPFTDYDFYAYLTSGGLLLAVFDYVFHNAGYLSQQNWTFAQIVIAIAAAYVLGHMVAMLAQTVLETFAISHLVSKPIALQLGFSKPNRLERLVGLLVGRYYGPMPESTRTRILQAVSADLGRPVSEITDPEDVFLLGFRKSFTIEGARQRIDDFRNQYGFCRNIAFVGLLATGLLAWKAWYTGSLDPLYLALGSALVFVGMFIRFVKFLASFQAEIVRAIK